MSSTHVPSPPPRGGDGNHDGSIVQFSSVTKLYRGAHSNAVDGISLSILAGEFFSILGPSGSGKTTCLRLIAGFEQPTSGTILLAGKDVVGTPAYRRDVNTVFQNYALFPHMTIAENIAYPLRMQRLSKADIAPRVDEALSLVEMREFGSRLPHQLSGGQRQRVALARALVARPSVLLLDEPLGALDLQLRQQMQVVLKEIQREVGITFVYVTHDQGEALSMSDRLAVMSAGRIEQVGTPREVYFNPVTPFVAGFIGKSNIGSGRVFNADGQPVGQWGGLEFPVPAGAKVGECFFSLRPEAVVLGTGGGDVVAEGTVTSVVFLGDSSEVGILRNFRCGLPSVSMSASDSPCHFTRPKWCPSMASPAILSAGLWRKVSLAPLIVWAAILVLLPNLLMLVFSFWQTRDGVLIREFTISNYIDVLTNDVSMRILGQTMLVALGASLLATAIAYPMAWFVVRKLSRHRLLAVLMVIVPLWISYLVRVYAWKIILGESGVINSALLNLGLIQDPLSFMLYSRFAVFLTLTYVSIPFAFVASYAALERLPTPLLEASADAGASPLRTYWTIVWPLSRQGVGIGFALAFLLCVGDYLTPAMVGGLQGTMFGSLIVNQFGLANNWPLGAAMSIVLLLATAALLAVIARVTRTDAVLE